MKHEVYLSTAITAAKKAGALIKKEYERGSHVSYSYKDAHNIVTKTDIEAEKMILATIEEAFPTHSIFSEEKGMIEKNSDYLWIIDPLDGTTNFVRQFPHFDVSLALIYKKDPLIGIVYQPMRDELFTAKKGKGALLNGKKIQMSDCQRIEKALIALTRGSNEIEKIRGGRIVNILTHQVRSIRILGAANIDLCYTASGKFDAMINNGSKIYDCAAPILITKEAGARITDFKGNEWEFTMEPSDVVVSNLKLHHELISILKDF